MYSLCFILSAFEEHHLLFPVGFACEPGNAGKSSLLMVNSEVSGVGCFTMPTVNKDHQVKTITKANYHVNITRES